MSPPPDVAAAPPPRRVTAPSAPHGVAYAAPDGGLAARLGLALVVAVPTLLTVWLAFSSGGFFAGAAGAAAVVLAAALGLQVLVAPRPFAGYGPAALVPAAGLAGLTAWMLLSATWSDATGRALVEHARPLAYLLAFLLLAGTAFSARRLTWLIRALAAALAGIAICGLITRMLPEVWSVAPSLQPGRLAYPISYWNGMGLLSTCAALLCVHLVCDEREPPWIRALAAAVVPALTVTVLLTFSRGAIVAGVLGLLVYLAAARPRGAWLGLAATLPTSAVALVVAYGADALASRTPQSAEAVTEGRRVAAAVVVAGLVAALPLVVWAAREARRRRWGLPARPAAPAPPAPETRRRAGLAAAGVGALLVVVALAAGAGGALADQVDDFLEGNDVPERADTRTRLTELGNNGRIEHWEVALDGFAADRLKGQGAGTYQLLWNQESGRLDSVVDGHSLYVETLGELGLVGLALVLLAVLGVLVGLLARVRAREAERQTVAIVLAVFLVWALCAGIDWDWELPAVTLWVFALAGAALARRPAPTDPPPGPRSASSIVVRALAVTVCAAVAVLPLALARSQASLDRAVDALRAGDGQTAAQEAVEAIDALPDRAEPWEALGYGTLLAGNPERAVEAMHRAAQLDPRNWEPLYGLALTRAAARDPLARATAKRAVALSPMQRTAQELMWSLDAPSREWDAAVAKAPLLIPATLGTTGAATPTR